jgi:glycosyltransferase involved in cell wall biosynthesis
VQPGVSVVIATYNCGRFLPEAVESVLRQTYRDWELIIVDDGSADDTPGAVQPFLADARVRYHRRRHEGQSLTKNHGVHMTRAPLVAFLDADDVWLPEKLARQVGLFRADPDLGVAFARHVLIDEQGRELATRQPPLPSGGVLNEIFRTNFVCFSSAVVRRAALASAGLFDPRLCLAVDYDLWLRVALRFRFDYVDSPLVKYRTGHASLSRRVEQRLAVVTGIMARFLANAEAARALDRAAVREALAETHYHIALAARERSRLTALGWYLSAVARNPRYFLAWQGLASLALPERCRRWCRRALGRPAHWGERRVATQPRDFSVSRRSQP